MIPSFWSLFWSRRRAILLQWDAFLSICIGLLCALVPGDENLKSRYTGILVAESGLAAGLLGVVLAALAIVLAFMNEKELRLLTRTGGGLKEDIFPYSYTAMICVVAVILGFVFSAIVAEEHEIWIRVSLFLTSTVFVYAVMSIMSLIKALYRFTEIRAALLSPSENAEDAGASEKKGG